MVSKKHSGSQSLHWLVLPLRPFAGLQLNSKTGITGPDYCKSFTVSLVTTPKLQSDSTSEPPQPVPVSTSQVGDDTWAPFACLLNRYRKGSAGNNTELSSRNEPKNAMRALEKNKQKKPLNSGPNQNYIFAFESTLNFQINKKLFQSKVVNTFWNTSILSIDLGHFCAGILTALT